MKRFLYILSVLAVSVVLVCIMLLAALMSDKVETAAVQLATAEFSRALGTRARVGAIEYRFPARLSIRDVYIEDRQRDTLLYAGELYAHFRPMPLKNGEIRFSHVRLNRVTGNLYQLADSSWNYRFLTDAFRREKKSDNGPLRSLISVKDVQLDDLRLRYGDIVIRLPHADMDLHQLSTELLDAQISDFRATVTRLSDPSHAFRVEELKAQMVMNDTALSFPTMKARLANSRLDISGIQVRFPAGDTLYLSRSAHEITFALNFNEALFVPSDIALFVPRVQGLKRAVTLNGALSGTLDSLAFDQIEVRYDGRTVLKGDVSAAGLPDLNNPYLRANLQEVHTNAVWLQDFLSQLDGHPVRLPKQLHRLGDIHYRGQAEGRLHDLSLHGAFRTALGTITTDGSLQADSLFEHMTYDARIVARHFRLGRMTDNPSLGSTTLDFRSNGRIDTGEVRGDVKAHVRQLTYNGYTYNDLHLNGHYEPQHYHGRCAIHDPHMDMSFDGVVDLKDVNPEINFNLQCAHFDAAPLAGIKEGRKGASPLRTSFSVAVDMSGAKPDEISGYLVIDSLFLATPLDSMLMKQLTVFVSADPNMSKAMTMRSDFGHAQLDGTFRYADIVPAAQALLHRYLPNAVGAPTRHWYPVSFSLLADGERLRDVQRLFDAGLTISDHTTVRMEAELAEGRKPYVSFRLFAPGVRAGNTPVHDLTIGLKTQDQVEGHAVPALCLDVSADALKMHTTFSTYAFRDTLLTHLNLDAVADSSDTPVRPDLSSMTFLEQQRAIVAAQRAGKYGGDIRCITHFSRYNKKPLIDLHFLPGTLLIRDSLYTLSESRVTWCAADTSVQVEHFAFEGGGQHIRAHGLASRRRTDTLSVALQRLDASYIMPFILPKRTIMFNGLLTGEADIVSTFRKPQIETQIHIDSMGLNDCLFGDAEVDLHIRDSLQFHADVHTTATDVAKGERARNVVTLDGMALFDGSGTWNLDMMTDSVPLDFINHWTFNVLRDLDGHASGPVVVGGSKKLGVYVLIRCEARNASLTLPWTGARYTIASDTIVMDTTAILFPDVHLTDGEGHPVEVQGGVYHDQFRDFSLDLHVDAHEALVFDTQRPGEMLQGHVYADGHVDVTGPQEDILVSANAVTTKNSRFRLSLDKASSAYESNFIHFVEHPEAGTDTVIEHDLDNIDHAPRRPQKGDEKTVILHNPEERCLLKLNLEVNPQLLFQLVIGERNEDMIQARGNGALRLVYDTQTEDVSLLGTYGIDQGTLSYTIANVIRKEFTIGEGATIVFSGDATNPMLNVTAKYRAVANLRDLFGDETSQVGTSRTNIPVLTCLHMQGALSNPVLSFSLEFPSSDQSVQEQVRQVINTDEMLMRQVIYLLVFGRFFTPDYMSNAQYATLNSTYSLLSSTVTGQINAWLSKLTTMLTLGVAIRTEGEGEDASQEYEAQFQLQPVDRLIINGNFGYRYNDISNQPFFGDLDAEVLLTEDGQWRLKGYTHTVDRYSLRQASTIQGVGFVWKKDFNWPTAKKKEKKKEKTKPSEQ